MKKALSIILIFILFLLPSCGGRNDYYTVGGETFEVCRGSSGSIILNDAGELSVYVLTENRRRMKDETGEDITAYIPFDGSIINGRNVETPDMSFTLPEGFSLSGSDPGVYVSPDSGGEIFIELFDSRTAQSLINEALSESERLLESYGAENFSYKQYTILTSDDLTATAVMRRSTSSEYFVTSHLYFTDTPKGAYRITCNTRSDSRKSFDSFIKSIRFTADS